MPTPCGGDRPRRPPDGGASACVEPACPSTHPRGDRDIPLALDLFVGDVARPYLWKPGPRMGLLGAPRMQVFPLLCPRCGQPMRIIAFVTDSGSITHILAYLGELTKVPYIAPAARGPPREEDFEPARAPTSASHHPSSSSISG